MVITRFFENSWTLLGKYHKNLKNIEWMKLVYVVYNGAWKNENNPKCVNWAFQVNPQISHTSKYIEKMLVVTFKSQETSHLIVMHSYLWHKMWQQLNIRTKVNNKTLEYVTIKIWLNNRCSFLDSVVSEAFSMPISKFNEIRVMECYKWTFNDRCVREKHPLAHLFLFL